MPLLDVNEAFDPSFLDTILVDRIREVVDQFGRVRRYKTRYTVANAVVTAASPSDLRREPNYELMAKSIDVYVPQGFRLQGPVRDPVSGAMRTQPDEIIWHGSTFVVNAASDFSGYGMGYTYAHASSIEAMDAPPLGGHVPLGTIDTEDVLPMPHPMGNAD